MISGKRHSSRLFLALLAVPLLSAGEESAISIKEIFKPSAQSLVMRFQEEKSMQILSQAVTSRGLLRFIPPDTLVREDEGSRGTVYRIEGNQVSISEGNRILRQFDLDTSPEIAGIATSLRALLAADGKALEEHYTLILSGSGSDWMLQLTPRFEQVSRIIEKILIRGGDGQIQRIDTYEQSGDISRMILIPDG